MTEHAPLIIDVAGTGLTDADRRRLAHPLVGGIILFARNWQDRAQLLQLTAAIKAVRHDLLICVDHEGGRVQRFRSDGFTHVPPMRALGELWMNDGKGRARAAAPCAPWMRPRPPAMCWAPSCAPAASISASPRCWTLDWGESGVIGDRAFARDPRVVAMLARALMQGLLQAGMANCGKHFPGHGFVKADSHTEIPIDRRSLKAILAEDAAPYPWLSTVLTSVMPAHVIYPKVDARPAGFSAKWLQDILRGRLRFDGAIFSDDLSMEGARRLDGQLVSYTDAGVAALNAGCDLVLLCNQSLGGGAAVDELIDGLATAQAQGRWQASAASEARRLALLPETLPQPWDDLMVQPAYMHALDLLP